MAVIIQTKDKKVTTFAKLLRTAGDESRLRILCVIFDERKICVSDIARRLDMSIAIVSHHLKILSQTGLLRSVREGKEICYLFESSLLARDLKRLICKYK